MAEAFIEGLMYLKEVFYPRLIMLYVTLLSILIGQLIISRAGAESVNNSHHSAFIPNSLHPRHKKYTNPVYPVLNAVRIHSTCHLARCPDYHVSTVFISDHELDVMVRRIDSIGWSDEIKLFIESEPSCNYSSCLYNKLHVKELFILEACSSCAFMQTRLRTTILLIRDETVDQYQTIPKAIIQTYRSMQYSSDLHYNAHQTFVDLNPEYEIRMFGDNDCRRFIQQHYSPAVLEAYDVLIAPTFKADLFRYAYLALYGGCYFDHKMILRQPLRRVITRDDELLLCSDAVFPSGHAPRHLSSTTQLYNAVMCSSSANMHILYVLGHVVQNIQERISTGRDLRVTGPIALYNSLMSLQEPTERTKFWKLIYDFLSDHNPFHYRLPKHNAASSMLETLLSSTGQEMFFPYNQFSKTVPIERKLKPLQDSQVPFHHGIHHKGFANRNYRDYFVKDKRNGKLFLHKFFPDYQHIHPTITTAATNTTILLPIDSNLSLDLHLQSGETRRQLSGYSQLWNRQQVYYERIGFFGKYKLYGFPSISKMIQLVSVTRCPRLLPSALGSNSLNLGLLLPSTVTKLMVHLVQNMSNMMLPDTEKFRPRVDRSENEVFRYLRYFCQRSSPKVEYIKALSLADKKPFLMVIFQFSDISSRPSSAPPFITVRIIDEITHDSKFIDISLTDDGTPARGGKNKYVGIVVF